MLKVKNLVTPSPETFNVVIHGMRNAFKSWDKSDSFYITDPEICRMEKRCNSCPYHGDVDIDHYWCWARIGEYSPFALGNKDKQLLLNLCKAGDPSHRKVLRQLPVIMDITAPLYWHKQMDQYKVGTVTNSESTMHCMVKEPFDIKDFQIKNFEKIDVVETEDLEVYDEETDNILYSGLDADGYTMNPDEYFRYEVVGLLNALRYWYLKTKDMKYWYAINELLPQSYNQTRTWSANYEVLVTIIQQRRNHKLSEWHEFIDYLLENVPYLKEIVEAIDETKKETT